MAHRTDERSTGCGPRAPAHAEGQGGARHAWVLLLLAALAAPLALSAQDVTVTGGERSAAARLAREIVAAGGYVRMDRDTILPRDFRAPALVITDAEVRLEGEVAGNVALLGGELFLRPGARIGGTIAVVGGTVYRSRLATVEGGILEDTIPLPTRVVRAPETGATEIVVVPREGDGLIRLPGLLGLRLPTYDRVDGVTFGVGAALSLEAIRSGAELEGWVSYRAGRESPGGGARLSVPLLRGHALEARASRQTRTNDAWIRGPLSNTAAALVTGTDERNYFESDQLSLTVRRRLPGGLLEGEIRVEPRAGLTISRDRSLPVLADAWSLLGDLDRPNPAVLEGVISSAHGGAAVRWRGRISMLQAGGMLEHAFIGPGEASFTRWEAEGTWSSLALRQHTIAVRFHGAGVVQGGPLPRQRWTFVGGPSTLPVLDVAEVTGDRVVYIRSTYGIPLAAPRVPLLGTPDLRFVHAVGGAWVSGGETRKWHQNVGAGLYFALAHVDLFVDPTDPAGRVHVGVGASLPAF